jgi:hypothetical protein
MNGRRLPFMLLLGLFLVFSATAAGQEADPDRDADGSRDDRLGLADLAAYRAALSGRATADEARPSDPPVPVGFRDLWNRPEAYRGRRVTIRGRLERSFRQGAVGSFPPLVEAWIFSPSGDPFCLVYPRVGADAGTDAGPGTRPPGVSAPVSADDARRPDARPAGPAEPGPGRMVRFTGTFLKMVRYTAGDGDRLAPLIVGDHPPARQSPDAAGEATATPPGGVEVLRAIGGGPVDDGPRADGGSWSRSSWILGLVLTATAAAAIAAQHLRGAWLRDPVTARARLHEPGLPDPPLHFVDSPGDAAG